MPDEQSTRDRVRALVREVLNNALPEEESGDASQTAPSSSASAPAATTTTAPPKTTTAAVPPRAATTVMPHTGSAKSTANAPDEKPIARDESSKTVITEADVHGLERRAGRGRPGGA